MAEYSSSVCAICYRGLTDARLLNCLHSFCKTCLDDVDMRTGHDHEISCPLCRRKTLLPNSGASSLTKDLTAEEERPRECSTCRYEEGQDTEAKLWCTTCDVVFCKDHGVEHLLANSEHSIKPFPDTGGRHKASRTSSALRHCQQHHRPLEYFCKQCRKAVCGECTALGEHHLHKPIVPVKEIAKDLKRRVLHKIDKLKTARLPRVERALADVDQVTTELSSRAEQVRTKIRSSRKCVLDAVELLFEQKIAEVDDLEELRLKHLRSQKDELKLEVDGLKSVLCFGEKVLEVDVETEGLSDLLFAVDKRADELEKAEVEEQPVEDACLDFEEVNEDGLLAKASALVGEVLPFDALDTHSCVEDGIKKTCREGSSVNFVVVSKDKTGRRLAEGGKSIRAEMCQSATEVGPSPRINILDKKDGTYMISIRAQGQGEFSFDVFVNNVRLQQRLSIICHHPARFTFDPAECQAGSTISADQLTVIHTGRDMTYSSVLSRHGMSSGVHVWKVSVADNKHGMNSMNLGVAEKPELTKTEGNLKYMYGWHGMDGRKYILDKKSGRTSGWEDNDVLQFHLNCTKHTLTITNLRSAETDTISNLPPTELFAYFFTYWEGQSFTLLQ